MAKQKKKKRSIYSQLPKKKASAGFTAPQFTVQSVQSVQPGADTDAAYSAQPSMQGLKELVDSGRREAFLNMLSEVDLTDPQNTPELPELGNILMRVKDFDSAATIFRAWSEAEPGNAKAFNSLGTALVSSNWLDAGQVALTQAVALEPGQEIYQFNLAKLYMVREMWEQAKSMLMNLQHSFPESKDKVDELLAQFPED